ncbi:M23 family metallopeptidase [Nonomuraea lactucae]|uniref:murein hydrolase activator EnvC family protein n=1 Tax=Nonomuraea lactucae TaxID=2249762 RepID=UPI000DE302A8
MTSPSRTRDTAVLTIHNPYEAVGPWPHGLRRAHTTTTSTNSQCSRSPTPKARPRPAARPTPCAPPPTPTPLSRTVANSPRQSHPTFTRAHPPPSHPRAGRVTVSVTTVLTAILFASAVLTTCASPAAADPTSWRWPLDGHQRILRRFAPPPERWLSGHRGIDLAARPSAPVLAASAGTVRYAGPLAGRGVVSIDHPGGLRTTYIPVTASVRRGQHVARGDRLGVVEESLTHCREPCLHWGLLRAPRYLDPLLLLGQAHVRLLPYWQGTDTSPPIPPPETHRTTSTHDLPPAAPHRPTRGPATSPPPTPPWGAITPALIANSPFAYARHPRSHLQDHPPATRPPDHTVTSAALSSPIRNVSPPHRTPTASTKHRGPSGASPTRLTRYPHSTRT